MNTEQIIKDLEGFTKNFNCCHQGYVEACGLICKVRREMIHDLSGKQHPECNENCKDYEPLPDIQAMRNALALIKEQQAEKKKLTEERDAFIRCAYEKQHLLNSINEKLEQGYELSAAKACAEMEMWHRISLQEKELVEENERLQALLDETIDSNAAWVEDNGRLRKEMNTIKVETVQKFAEYLKKHAFLCDPDNCHSFDAIDVDDMDDHVEGFMEENK